jgi:hypothetical protein
VEITKEQCENARGHHYVFQDFHNGKYYMAVKLRYDYDNWFDFKFSVCYLWVAKFFSPNIFVLDYK